ncbi:DUF1269 domain-containing family protein [Lactobacillus sp. ESL0791]|uniref:DUF1269 domain-containing family protein n=1 Tax=Lactobacillus sp. ESL0791 TaxID=2983234 RepID=UPI0023F7A7EA|nr:DUF1269 domain-containing family protein [Lactobacillus sp. ESL0791]MDF7638474.1 DUF1269 domain-containing family protein [Lactobacillus sp. ESL0791]
MSKFTSFLVGTVVGCAAGFVAGSLLISDEKIDSLKKKVKDNNTVQDLKKKYDNGTEVVKNQLSAFSKNVEDDSELKDFDDIVIDDSKDDKLSANDNAEKSVSDIDNAEKETNSSSAPYPNL